MEQSETLYSNPAILEAATRALDNCIEGYQTTAILAAVTPLIEAAALERAALMAEHMLAQPWVRDQVAAAIRALKEQP